jgi:uncharacterized membrane protein
VRGATAGFMDLPEGFNTDSRGSTIPARSSRRPGSSAEQRSMPEASSDSSIWDENRAEVLDLAAVLVAAALLFVVLVGWAGLPRLLLAVLFTFFVPGRAIVSNWPRMAAWAELAMNIGISLASLTLLALLTLWFRIWQPELLFVVEALLSLVGLGIAITRRRRSYFE